MNQCDQQQFSEVLVEKIKLACAGTVCESILKDCDIEIIANHMAGMIVAKVTTAILAIPGETISIHLRYPGDWWQAFRGRWFPKWWLDRYPVTCDEIDIEKKTYKAVCPHLVALDRETHIEWMMHPERE